MTQVERFYQMPFLNEWMDAMYAEGFTDRKKLANELETIPPEKWVYQPFTWTRTKQPREFWDQCDTIWKGELALLNYEENVHKIARKLLMTQSWYFEWQEEVGEWEKQKALTDTEHFSHWCDMMNEETRNNWYYLTKHMDVR